MFMRSACILEVCRIRWGGSLGDSAIWRIAQRRRLHETVAWIAEGAHGGNVCATVAT